MTPTKGSSSLKAASPIKGHAVAAAWKKKKKVTFKRDESLEEIIPPTTYGQILQANEATPSVTETATPLELTTEEDFLLSPAKSFAELNMSPSKEFKLLTSEIEDNEFEVKVKSPFKFDISFEVEEAEMNPMKEGQNFEDSLSFGSSFDEIVENAKFRARENKHVEADQYLDPFSSDASAKEEEEGTFRADDTKKSLSKTASQNDCFVLFGDATEQDEYDQFASDEVDSSDDTDFGCFDTKEPISLPREPFQISEQLFHTPLSFKKPISHRLYVFYIRKFLFFF